MEEVHGYPLANTTIGDIRRRVGRAIEEYADDNDTPVDKIRHLWHKTKLDDGSRVSAFIKNTQEDVSLRRLKDEILSMVKEYAPKYPTIKREKCKD